MQSELMEPTSTSADALELPLDLDFFFDPLPSGAMEGVLDDDFDDLVDEEDCLDSLPLLLIDDFESDLDEWDLLLSCRLR